MFVNLRLTWVIFFYVFSRNIIKVNHFLYCFFLMLHLISSFLYARYLFSPYAYAFIELIDCIVLSLLALNLIILISSVNTLYFLFLNLCCDFNFFFFLINFLWLFLRLTASNLFFFFFLVFFMFSLRYF